jgi:hypothetical protein
MKAVLKLKHHGKISLGKSNQKWIDNVKDNLTEIGIRDGETVTLNRNGGKQVSVSVIGLNGL